MKKRLIVSVVIAGFFAIVFVNTLVSACYSFKVSCEGATTGWWAGSYVGQPYKEIFPPKHEINAGESYTYDIEVRAKGGCEREAIKMKTSTIDHNLPQGWTKSLTDKNGNNLEGKEWKWKKSDWGTPLHIYFKITAPSNAPVGETAKVSVRVYSAGIKPANEECTCDVTTETTVKGSPPPQILEKVVVTPVSCSIEVGLKQKFVAKGYDQNNQEIPGIIFTWNLNGSIGSINPTSGESTTFTATTVGNGTIEATGSAGGSTKTGSAKIEVKPQSAKLTKVVVIPDTCTLRVNDTKDFKAEGYDQNNQIIPGLVFNWQLTTPIGTVSPSTGETTTFKATTVGTGNLEATATLGNITKTGSASITVKPELILDKVTVTPDSVVLEVGRTETFTATAYDNEGNTIQGLDYHWSDFGSIGEMNVTGNPNTFTATKPGSAIITVETTYKNVTKTASASVEVKSPPQPMLFAKITVESATVYSGDTTNISVYVTDGVKPVQDVTVVPSSSIGGTFNPSQGLTNAEGLFVTSFETPSVNTETTLTITAKASKENYKDSTVDTKITVLPKILYPDLEVLPITFSNEHPIESEKIVIKTGVRNIGQTDAKNVKVEIFVGGTQIGDDYIIKSLPKDSTKHIEVLWITVKGTHSIKVIVDSDRTITEINENNNMKSAKITVKSASSPPQSDDEIEEEDGIPTDLLLPVGLVLCGLCIAIIIGILASKRRKKKQPQYQYTVSPYPPR